MQLQALIVDIGELATGYKIPGQFVQIKVGDSKPGFYAIASPPEPNNLGYVELLVKSIPGTTAEILAQSSAGDTCVSVCSTLAGFLGHARALTNVHASHCCGGARPYATVHEARLSHATIDAATAALSLRYFM